MVCLLAVASARPQLYNDYNTVETYSDITDENDPRFGFDVSSFMGLNVFLETAFNFVI